MNQGSQSKVVNLSAYRLKKLQDYFLNRKIGDDILEEINENKRLRNEIFRTIKELTNTNKKVK